MAEQRMYAATDGTRWFRVPTDREIPLGELEVKDLLGRTRRWSAEALAPYAVPAAQVRDLTRQELVGWLAKAEGGIASLRAAMDEKEPGKGDALNGLQTILGTIGDRLRAPGEPRPGTAPVDLRAKLEEFLKTAADDPSRVETLRQVAADLEAAAERMKKR
jgi:hypothetical protein